MWSRVPDTVGSADGMNQGLTIQETYQRQPVPRRRGVGEIPRKSQTSLSLRLEVLESEDPGPVGLSPSPNYEREVFGIDR